MIMCANQITGTDLEAIMTSELQNLVDEIEKAYPSTDEYVASPRWLLRKVNKDIFGFYYEAQIHHSKWEDTTHGEYDSGFGDTPEEALRDAYDLAQRRTENGGVQTYPLVERALAAHAKRQANKKGAEAP